MSDWHSSQYAIQRNFAENLFSVYDPTDPDPIFQIDANFGYPAAVMVILIIMLTVYSPQLTGSLERAHTSTRCREHKHTTSHLVATRVAHDMVGREPHGRTGARWYHRRYGMGGREADEGCADGRRGRRTAARECHICWKS